MPFTYPQSTLNLRELLSVFFAGFIPIFLLFMLCPSIATEIFTPVGSSENKALTEWGGLKLALMLALSIPVGYFFNAIGHFLLGWLTSRSVRYLLEWSCFTEKFSLGNAQTFKLIKKIAVTSDTGRLLHICTMLCQTHLRAAYMQLERIEGLYILLRSLVVPQTAFIFCALCQGKAYIAIVNLVLALIMFVLSILVEAFLMYRRAFLVTSFALVDDKVRDILREFLN